jgi:glycosyltransferase involved in cell wall biosynthesis
MTGSESKSDHDAPLVSVLICSFNAEKFVEATVRSVTKQTYRNLEILILDNASSDGTVEVLERLGGEDARLKLHRSRENLGAYGGLNYLLDRAAGAYIAIQDHDDIWHEDKIRRQVEFLEANSCYVGCGTAIINYYEKYDKLLLRRHGKVANVAWHTSIVFRSTEKRYDSSARIGNDFLFMKNVLCEDRRLICNLDDPLVLRKIGANDLNLSTRWIKAAGLKEILSLRISAKDKVPLMCRSVLPAALVDYLLLKVVLRRDVLPRESMSEGQIWNEYAEKGRSARWS